MSGTSVVEGLECWASRSGGPGFESLSCQTSKCDGALNPPVILGYHWLVRREFSACVRFSHRPFLTIASRNSTSEPWLAKRRLPTNLQRRDFSFLQRNSENTFFTKRRGAEGNPLRDDRLNGYRIIGLCSRLLKQWIDENISLKTN